MVEEEEKDAPKGKVIIYGFLQKRSKYIHLWKTRFFILTDHYLFAFTGIENDADCTMALDLSSINEVKEIESKKENKKEFVIKCIESNYFFRAENPLVLNRWISELNNIINKKKDK